MAVYTHISEKDLAEYLRQFDIGSLVSFLGIAEGVENTNYRITATGGAFILTLFEKRVRPEDLPFCLDFMEHLHRQDIPCAAVVCDKAGQKIVPFLGKPAVITTFLQGMWPRHIETFHAAAVGKTLARMHNGGHEFSLRRENAVSLSAWRKLIGACEKHIEPGLFGLLMRELDDLEREWPRGLPAGAVHADLFPDNVFFTDKSISGVIDFYFSCTDILAYDLMIALNAWCFTADGILDRAKATAFLDAYQQERPLTDLEKQALPVLGRGAALRFLSTRLYDLHHPVSGAAVTAKDPAEYLRILQYYRSGAFLA